MAGLHKILSYLFKNLVCPQKIGKQFYRLAVVTNMEQSLNIVY